MKKRFFRVLVMVIVAAAASGSVFSRRFQPGSGREAANGISQTELAAAQTSVEVVSAEGRLVPWQTASLSFLAGGRVATVLVEAGEFVEAGTPLVRLDAAALESALAQTEAGLALAQADLASAQAQLVAAQAGLTAAEQGVEMAQANLTLVMAPPLPEEITIADLRLEAAESGIDLAAGNRNVALDVATEAQIRSAEARVAQAMATVRVLQDAYDYLIDNEILGPPEEDARLQLQSAQSSLAAAQAALDELNAGATLAQQRAANAGVSAAAAERDAAQAQLDLLVAGATSAQVGQAEAAVQQAEALVVQAGLGVTQAEAVVVQMETAVAQAEAVRDAAQDRVAQMTLTAPFAGRVAALTVEIGQVVAPGVPVGQLADFSRWLVETADLTELDIVAVQPELAVEVRVDALPEEVLRGRVTEIAAVSALTRGDVTYTVTILLDDTLPGERQLSDYPLRWGMTAFVDVMTGP